MFPIYRDTVQIPSKETMTSQKNAVKEGHAALSEYESKQLLKRYNIPITEEIVVTTIEELEEAVKRIGFPLVEKGCSAEITHKTEMGLIKIDIRTIEEARDAFQEIQRKMPPQDKSVLVQEMIKGQRELVIGMTRDPQFGPCVMFGLGGIFTEILRDVSFRVAPLEERDALNLMSDIKGEKILDAVRGMKAIDRNELARLLMAVGRIGLENEEIQEIDINPLKIDNNGKLTAVDALVVISK